MGVFKAACVAWDTDVMPDWVSHRLKTAGIDFVAHKCESSAQVLSGWAGCRCYLGNGWFKTDYG